MTLHNCTRISIKETSLVKIPADAGCEFYLKILPFKVKSYVYQADEHRYFDERPDDCSEGLS